MQRQPESRQCGFIAPTRVIIEILIGIAATRGASSLLKGLRWRVRPALPTTLPTVRSFDSDSRRRDSTGRSLQRRIVKPQGERYDVQFLLDGRGEELRVQNVIAERKQPRPAARQMDATIAKLRN